MLAVGLMSGTSLDGIDAVLCEISGSGLSTQIKELAFETYPFPVKLRVLVQRIAENQPIGIAEICSVNFELGQLFADAVLALCSTYGIKSSELGFIASHGQTVYHIPKPQGELVASTLQLGESAVIAYKCQCPVISNFRTMDMAAGGEGAPLVPFSEYILYRSEDKAIALQNIGGIGNVTLIPKSAKLDQVFAFDTGPGNMMINDAMQHLYQKSYDDRGAVAARGKLIEELVNELKAHPYLQTIPPKSTGREEFGSDYTGTILEKYQEYPPEDVIATLTWFTAYSIAFSYQHYVLPDHQLSEVILAGGGVHNLTLKGYIQQMMPNISIVTQEERGYSSDSKEALAFVILGNETLHHQTSNVPSATGAKENVILGTIVYHN